MKLKLNKIKSTFDVTIGQFQKFNQIEDPTDIDIVSIFYNLDEDAVKLISHKDVKKLANDVKEALNKQPEHITKYKDLAFEPDLENMSAGAYGDAITYAQSIDTAHLFTVVLYRPIKKDLNWWFKRENYNIKEYKGASQISNKAKDLPLALFLSAQGFFLTLRNDLLNAIQNRFQQKNKQLSQNLKKKDYKDIGASLYRFMQLLEETTNDFSMKQEKNQLVK